MMSTSLSGINSPYPETEGGVKAGIAEVNDSGGIDGHPVQLSECFVQDDATAQTCATRMANDMNLPDSDFLKLRNEAIASLALPDLRISREWDGWPTGSLKLTHIDTQRRGDRHPWRDQAKLVIPKRRDLSGDRLKRR